METRLAADAYVMPRLDGDAEQIIMWVGTFGGFSTSGATATDQIGVDDVHFITTPLMCLPRKNSRSDNYLATDRYQTMIGKGM